MRRDFYKKMGLTYYHLSPLADIEISNKPAQNVVGIDDDHVYTFADSKKKPLEGSSDMKTNFKRTHDVCTNFAVGVSYFLIYSLNLVSIFHELFHLKVALSNFQNYY